MKKSICINCAFFFEGDGGYDECWQENGDEPASPSIERAAGGRCGPDGKFFKEREPNPLSIALGNLIERIFSTTSSKATQDPA